MVRILPTPPAFEPAGALCCLCSFCKLLGILLNRILVGNETKRGLLGPEGASRGRFPPSMIGLTFVNEKSTNRNAKGKQL